MICTVGLGLFLPNTVRMKLKRSGFYTGMSSNKIKQKYINWKKIRSDVSFLIRNEILMYFEVIIYNVKFHEYSVILCMHMGGEISKKA